MDIIRIGNHKAPKGKNKGLDGYTYCECCRCEGLEVKNYPEDGIERWLCELCAKTLTAHAEKYPRQQTAADAIRLNAQFTNIILAEIRSIKNKE